MPLRAPECWQHKLRAFKGVSVLPWPERLGCAFTGLPLSCIHSCLSSVIRGTARLFSGAHLADNLPKELCHSQPHHPQRCLYPRLSWSALSVLFGGWLRLAAGQPEARESSKQYWFPVHSLRVGGMPVLASTVFIRSIFWKKSLSFFLFPNIFITTFDFILLVFFIWLLLHSCNNIHIKYFVFCFCYSTLYIL